MNKPNSTCCICGNDYYCCQDNQEIKSFTPWKRITCSLEHYKIFLILRDYTNQMISKEVAKEKLSKCNLSDVKHFAENIRYTINEICQEKKQNKKNIPVNSNARQITSESNINEK